MGVEGGLLRGVLMSFQGGVEGGCEDGFEVVLRMVLNGVLRGVGVEKGFVWVLSGAWRGRASGAAYSASGQRGSRGAGADVVRAGLRS